MATRNECKEYYHCGYVAWRKEKPDGHITPLPEDGDCGISTLVCGRLNPEVPIKPTFAGPYFRSELEIALPERENNNGRPKRRLVGGCHS